jgi:transitional endoplasmic reticulum ATPase
LDPNEIINNRSRYDLIRIEVEGQDMLALVVSDHDQQFLSKVIDDLTTVKGFDCIAGMKELKNLLIAEVINPLHNPEKFEKFKVSIPNGIILYGPPGCGKTFIVRKLAEELGYNFFEVKHSDLATPFIHGSVGNIGKVFETAKQNSPSIVFFDEISGLVPNRQNLNDSSSHKEEEVNEFLVQLNDAADHKILVVGATNYIDRIDPAVLRPGRIDKKIYVSPPDREARIELFKLGLSGRPYDEKINFDKLSDLTDGYSSAEIIEGIIEGVSRLAANLNKDLIDQEMIEDEISRFKPVQEEEYKIGFSA